jgi:hypothetical protein
LLLFLLAIAIFCNASPQFAVEGMDLKYGKSNDYTKDETEFSKTMNISHNALDSVYSQVASSGENVYIVWEQAVGGRSNAKNYDIYLVVSHNGGLNFSKPMNISNNSGFSEHPQIVATGNNVYVLWVDNSNGYRQVLLRSSHNGGESFTPALRLSNVGNISFNAELDASGSNVVAVWNNYELSKGFVVTMVASNDRASSFENRVSLGSADRYSYPKVHVSKGQYYVTWNTNQTIDSMGRILFISIGNETNASLPSLPLKIASYQNDGEPQIMVIDRNVMIFWTSVNQSGGHNLYSAGSSDGGYHFSKISNLSENFNDSSNVETASYGKSLYLLWQEGINGNQEILLRMTTNNFSDFGKIRNVSNNNGTSECPSLSISNGRLHIVWEDDRTGNHEIFYRSLNLG